MGYSATAGAGTIASFRVILKCGQNAAFATSTMQNMMGYNDSSTYAPSRSYWEKRPRNNQSTTTPSNYNDYGYPATEPGGISISHGTTGGNANRTPSGTVVSERAKFFSAVSKSVILKIWHLRCIDVVKRPLRQNGVT